MDTAYILEAKMEIANLEFANEVHDEEEMIDAAKKLKIVVDEIQVEVQNEC